MRQPWPVPQDARVARTGGRGLLARGGPARHERARDCVPASRNRHADSDGQVEDSLPRLPRYPQDWRAEQVPHSPGCPALALGRVGLLRVQALLRILRVRQAAAGSDGPSRCRPPAVAAGEEDAIGVGPHLVLVPEHRAPDGRKETLHGRIKYRLQARFQELCCGLPSGETSHPAPAVVRVTLCVGWSPHCAREVAPPVTRCLARRTPRGSERGTS